MTESGFLNVFKPPGMTSHDVVAYLRRRLGPRKIGHGGTLDPVACGVLVCLVNGATRSSSSIVSMKKTYRAMASFGTRTDSGDVDGRVIERREVEIDRDGIEKVLPDFTGEITQVPPMTSAIKVGGRRLYKIARGGGEVKRPPRQVSVHSLRLCSFEKSGSGPRALLEVECSGGTYVRTLVEDIGKALDAPAFTSFLVRTAVGPFEVARALHPDEIDFSTAVKMIKEYEGVA